MGPQGSLVTHGGICYRLKVSLCGPPPPWMVATQRVFSPQHNGLINTTLSHHPRCLKMAPYPSENHSNSFPNGWTCSFGALGHIICVWCCTRGNIILQTRYRVTQIWYTTTILMLCWRKPLGLHCLRVRFGDLVFQMQQFHLLFLPFTMDTWELFLFWFWFYLSSSLSKIFISPETRNTITLNSQSLKKTKTILPSEDQKIDSKRSV